MINLTKFQNHVSVGMQSVDVLAFVCFMFIINLNLNISRYKEGRKVFHSLNTQIQIFLSICRNILIQIYCQAIYQMKPNKTCLLAICLIVLLIQSSNSTSLSTFATFSNVSPSNFYLSPYVTSTDKFKFVITWTSGVTFAGAAQRVINGAKSAYSFTSPTTDGSTYYIAEQPVAFNGYIELEIKFASFTPYTIQIFINGVLVRSESAYALGTTHIPLNAVTIKQACRLKMVLSGSPMTKIGVFSTTVFGSSSPDYSSATGEIIIDFPKSGTYYIASLKNDASFPATSTPTDPAQPFTLNIYTYCDSFCTSPTFPNAASSPSCRGTTCGNAILEEGEECDNGNKAGCNSCFVVRGYTCYGNTGSSSFCLKYPVCGDSVVDQGQECDNGNKIGCSSNCKIDSGYKCSAVIGSASGCGFCGNGILEPGEECDNRNQLGCSNGCKVDPGYDCYGPSSNCIKRNPLCGNGVIQIAESCDDGNRVNGDGCGQSCLVEDGFSCSGQFGQSSNCKRFIVGPICGNGIFEAGEECDNGNQEGCFNCRVWTGYNCVNEPGSPSDCIPKVFIRTCGNGAFEPLKGEACDDGNKVSGDGCSSMCQSESGWICVEGVVCVTLDDPRIKAFCGNRNLETQLGEVCDDGNNDNGDGCNQYCQVEKGWLCRIINRRENRSYCISTQVLVSYCGDGVVEGNETCDDGFPRRNGDGCNLNCQVESGYACPNNVCRLIP